MSEYQATIDKLVRTMLDKAGGGCDASRHLLGLYVEAAYSMKAILDAGDQIGLDIAPEDIVITGLSAIAADYELCTEVLVERLSGALCALNTPKPGKLLN